jgi:beta-galactosidase
MMRKVMAVLLLLALLPVARGETAAVRERLLLDFGWRFHQDDPEDAIDNGTNIFDYPEPGTLDKTRTRDLIAAAELAANRADPVAINLGGKVSFVQPGFEARSWRELDVPHDWAVELPFDPHGNAAHGKKDLDPKKGTTIGWYRRAFDLAPQDSGKAIWLEFDGVYRNAVIWLNGHCLGRHVSGYGSFMLDIGKQANFAGRNTLVVRVDATRYEGWFYEGAGIYRHVWLVKASPLHIAPWSTFVTTPEVTEKDAVVKVETTLTNDSDATRVCTVETQILQPDGQPIKEAGATGSHPSDSAAPVEVPAHGQKIVTQSMRVPQPQLWSPDAPRLYQASISLKEGAGDKTDACETAFGIRTFRWDPNQGFFLNGKRVEIKGTCNHQDHAGVGIALPDRIQSFRIEKLKEMGANAYRTAHAPPTPELLDACDRLGMMVMDETRRFEDSPLALAELETLIRRDRNHPSIILWSIGNEEPLQGDTNVGVRIATALQNLVHRLDPSRPATYANNGSDVWGRAVSTMIDIMGFNYATHGRPDRFHTNFPAVPCFGTEDAATRSTRGAYADDTNACFVSTYGDRKLTSGTQEEYRIYYKSRPWMAGLFIWTGFDYRGEPNPYKDRGYTCQDGMMDTCGFPKDNFYYCQAWWTDKPMVHLLPHWNWLGKEGQEIDVRCYSNCEEVELFLNGQSLGKQTMLRDSHLTWKVNYIPGTLLAKGYRSQKIAAEETIETTGDPAAISLAPDRAAINADGEDVAMVTVAVTDPKGRIVPVADNEISFSVTGGTIIGVGNGHPNTTEPDKSEKRKLFNGLAQVIVQSRKEAGPIKLTATSPGLQPVTATIVSTAVKLRPSVPLAVGRPN